MNIIPLPVNETPKDISRIFDSTIESGEFEDIACEWASGYLTKFEHYKNVAQIGGSKDSGRDIVAYLDDDLQRFDIFQCKRYKDPLSPSVYMSEFGKLCYYTMIGKYNKPRKYFIVASNGIGQDLRELIEHPKTINQRLIKDWNKDCKPKKKIFIRWTLIIGCLGSISKLFITISHSPLILFLISTLPQAKNTS